MENKIALRKINIRGVVQGVGFRPFVYRLAHEHGLTGWVLNHSGGVDIEVEGPLTVLDAFLYDLRAKAPPQACIEGISAADYPPNGYATFEIRESRAEEGCYQLISPDIATCLDCQRELFDPADRRYRYPFTNCTNCGPRFTIIKDIPYDRPLTTMRDFVMCPACQAEYDDPLDRRFHAQPNACPVCGPQIWLEASEEAKGTEESEGSEGRASVPSSSDKDVIAQAVRLLQEGFILAVKGLGGFHLACDATNQAAVSLLRARKRRPAKPLAVMMATLEEIKQHCCLSEAEERLLTSPQCPIVLLPWKKESSNVCELVAPRYEYLGVMLPYTPLHHVLLCEMKRPLVMTSGNLSEEPIAQENEEALRRLGHLADYFLLHNRDIYTRYDDSVWQVCDCANMGVDQQAKSLQLLQPIRRARGYAPFPIKLPFRTKHILACGAELKNTFCLTREEYAFLSQHIGDMENLETLEHFETTIELYRRLFRIEPEIVAYDMHPEYLATKYAQSAIRNPQSAIRNLQSAIPIQHHHAHIAACLADNGWPAEGGQVIGVAFDGTGYGTDGHIWGGEFLVADYHGFRRAGHLEYLPMPGGEAAIRNPYRLAISYLYTLLGKIPTLPFLTQVDDTELRIIKQQIDRGINSPLTSACGRLFDAVAALIGVRERVSYEAQAAIELEMIATAKRTADRRTTEGYSFGIDRQNGETIIRLRELFEGILADLKERIPTAEIGLRFHYTVVSMIVEMCQYISRDTGLRTVALSGGCFQNRLLLSKTMVGLREAGFEVLVHREVPCNDGGVSLGQAVIANFAMERR